MTFKPGENHGFIFIIDVKRTVQIITHLLSEHFLIGGRNYCVPEPGW